MSTTPAQKLAAICMPVAAIGLAFTTADPSWSPRREHYASWSETMQRAAAEKAAKAAPPATAPDPEAKKDPAAPETKKDPAPSPAPAPAPAPAPSAKKDPAPEPVKPALPQPEGIEFKVSGLAPCRNGSPLKTAAADRLDITVAFSGAYKVGVTFADGDAVKAALASAPDAQKKSGLLFVIPNQRSPWDSMKDVLNGGAGAGWETIGIAVAHPDNPGLARVLAVRVPGADADLHKGMDPVVVKVGTGNTPTFTLNGEECKDAEVLATKAKALHEECELMTEGYASDLARTPWTVDGTGAMVGGVVSALDALEAAGVKAVRIAGVQKPAAEGVPPVADPVPAPPAEEPKVPGAEEEKK